MYLGKCVLLNKFQIVHDLFLPVDVGCVTFKAAATATAASAAFPPASRIRIPACAANGYPHTTNKRVKV